MRARIGNEMPGSGIRLGLTQRVLVGVLVSLVLALGLVVYQNVNGSVDGFELIGNTGSTTSNIVIMQRESLMYSLEFERWLAQTSTRRDVQVRRGLLAQRLQARDSTGVANGERTHPEYFATLRRLDAAVATAPAGFLPDPLSSKLSVSLRDSLDRFTFEARELVGRISQSGDEQTKEIIETENERRAFEGLVVLSILFLIILTSLYLAISRLRDFRDMRRNILGERATLAKTRLDLREVEKELSQRVEEQEIDEREAKHLDEAIRELNARFRLGRAASTVVEDLVEGLGRILKADAVLYYSLNKNFSPSYLRNSSVPGASHLDGSMLTKLETEVSDLVEKLWARGVVETLSDTRSLHPEDKSLPSLLRESGKRVRSWLLVPVGEGSNVLGYVSIAMVHTPRQWSLREIAMVQAAVAGAANALVYRHSMAQEIQIAEHEAVVKQLLELDKAKDDFIANVNHELRTPLTSIIGYVEMALDDVPVGDAPVLRKSLETIERNAFRLQTLIEDMLQLARLDANFTPVSVAPVQVDKLIADIVVALEPESSASYVKVEILRTGSNFDVLGDASQLEQVFTNIISNAIKFTPKKGEVSITIEDQGDTLGIRVADTGVGIPKEEVDTVFQRFFRASTATTALIPGTGLGLSIVKRIVEGHQGEVTFVSEVGVGTTFAISLPREQAITMTSEILAVGESSA